MSNELAIVPTKINSTTAAIEFNYAELKESITQVLKDYDVVVTDDTVKSSRDLMAELNKQSKSISDTFKAKKKEVTAPVTEAEKQVKELVAMFSDARTKIADQVSKYDEAKKAEITEKMKAKLVELWESEGVKPEFQNATVEGSITLDCVTASGKVSSSGFRKLEALVATDKALQMQTESRLAKLESECYKAGLKVPFGRGHVEAFLFASDDEYTSRLESLIANEVSRQEQIEQATLAEAEKAKAIQEEPVQVEQEAIAPQPTELPNEPEPFHVEPQRDEREHRRQVNSDALKRVVGLGFTQEQAKTIITAAAMGELGALKMVY